MPSPWPSSIGLVPQPFETTAELLASSGWPEGMRAYAADDPTIVYEWSTFFYELEGNGWLEIATTSRATKWQLSTGAPSDADGNENDLDLDKATGAVYLKTGGVWEAQFVGGAGVYDPYLFSSATSGAAASGYFRFDNATENLATLMRISTTNAIGEAYHLAEGKKTDTLFRVQKVTDPSVYLTFRYSGLIGADWAIQVVEASSASPFTDNDAVVISWTHTGGMWFAAASEPSAALNGDWWINQNTFEIAQKQGGVFYVLATPPSSTPPLFGDGSDGAAVFDGVNPVTGASGTGPYTLTRDVFYTDATVTAGVAIITAGWKMFCSGTLTNAGTIHNDGGAASGTTAGTAAPGGLYGGGTAGGAGLASGTTTTAGPNGVATNSTGWHNIGSIGGAGGNSNGGNAGPVRTKSPVTGYHDLINILMGLAITPGTVDISGSNTPVVNNLAGGTGGGGGGRTSGGTAVASGAGGGGGGIVVVVARYIDNTGGTIRANGGNGGNAAGGTCSTGGGGGGGGGCLLLAYNTLTAGTETANGGTKGTGLNGAAAAADGTAGRVVKVTG